MELEKNRLLKENRQLNDRNLQEEVEIRRQRSKLRLRKQQMAQYKKELESDS
jgi:hypothetical protein